MSSAYKKGGKPRKNGAHYARIRKSRKWVPAGKDFRARKPGLEELRIKVSRELLWVLPYMERTHKILPRLQMPLAIKSYRPSLRKALRTLGSSYYDDGIINLATHEQLLERRGKGGPKIKRLRRFAKKKILETLAHELAHLHVPEHNFEHAELTRTIFRTFGIRRDCPYCAGRGKVEAECNPY